MQSTNQLSNSQKIVNYYKNVESRLGYTFLTWNAKHFGYYPTQDSTIGERKAQEYMQDLLAKKLHTKTGDLILDAGCGRGVVATYLASKYNTNIVGIDIVSFELEMAKKRAERMNLTDKVNFQLDDYSDTSFPNNHFNAIYTIETLVHSPNLIKTLKEFYRILKPMGKIVLFEYSLSYPKDFTDWEKQMLDIINKGSVMTSFEIMFHDKWPEYIKKSGFANVKEKNISKHFAPSLFRFINMQNILIK